MYTGKTPSERHSIGFGCMSKCVDKANETETEIVRNSLKLNLYEIHIYCNSNTVKRLSLPYLQCSSNSFQQGRYTVELSRAIEQEQ